VNLGIRGQHAIAPTLLETDTSFIMTILHVISQECWQQTNHTPPISHSDII